MLKFILSCFLFITLSNNIYAQHSRFEDSVKLDSLWDLMMQQNDKQNFDSAIVYAKQVDSLTYILYKSSRDYAQSLNNVGYFYNQNFDFENAATYYNKAIVILKNYAGENDSDYATYLNNLAALYDNLGEYYLADSLYKKSSSIR
jgi:tetratricopeptide (TPR) repeat protein